MCFGNASVRAASCPLALQKVKVIEWHQFLGLGLALSPQEHLKYRDSAKGLLYCSGRGKDVDNRCMPLNSSSPDSRLQTLALNNPLFFFNHYSEMPTASELPPLAWPGIHQDFGFLKKPIHSWLQHAPVVDNLPNSTVFLIFQIEVCKLKQLISPPMKITIVSPSGLKEKIKLKSCSLFSNFIEQNFKSYIVNV